jgi:hypothetical protein
MDEKAVKDARDEHVRNFYFRARLYSIIWFVIFVVPANYLEGTTSIIGLSIYWICQIMGSLCTFYFFYTFYLQKYDK